MGEEKSLLEGLMQELRRGTLVLSVLSQVREERYGYSLIQTLEEKGVPVDPNTLYPLLRRLEKQGLLESCWETGGSRPRKYYRRTGYGDEVYARLREQWIELAGGMDNLLKEDQA